MMTNNLIPPISTRIIHKIKNGITGLTNEERNWIEEQLGGKYANLISRMDDELLLQEATDRGLI